ncbi:hypothetical protein HPB47_026133 [Ixodes persulcatus]|uniref:Uncharacterized protein n=1 Tax=Ixodes persulcatus TaxID=34615 RepID=A0AC60PZL4_IXOPE|nr:hypothetical protein HPB47_026133 [Ixodes persulcatus]
MGMLKRSHNSCLVKGLFASLAVTCLVGLYYGYRLMVSNEAIHTFGRTVEDELVGGPGEVREPVHVAVVTSNARLGGAVALMASVARNTARPVSFHLVTDNATQYHVHAWMHDPRLSGLSYEVVTFPQTALVSPNLVGLLQLPFAKLYLGRLLPSVARTLVVLDDDVIVQDDKLEGFATRNSLTPGKPLSRWNFFVIHQLLGFSEDGLIDGEFLCLLYYESKLGSSALGAPTTDARLVVFGPYTIRTTEFAASAGGVGRSNIAGVVSPRRSSGSSEAQSRYEQYVEARRPSLQALGISATDCVLNLGVFVVDLAEWSRLNVTESAEAWMRLNIKEKLFKQEGPVPALLLALHNKTATLDPQWHVRNLGVTAGTQYSRLFVSSAKLLHWSGRFKPWSSRSPYADIWHRYFVPDPTGRFRPASKLKHRRGTTEGPSVRQLARRPVNGSV